MKAEDFVKFLPGALQYLARPPDEIAFSPDDKRRVIEYVDALAMVRMAPLRMEEVYGDSYENPPPIETIDGLRIRASDWIADGEPIFLWRDHTGRIDRLERVNFAV